ncbi:MAG: hypothetical protein MJ189_03110 [Coriobacteriales bacterium]|nr:hypothetical protein [Coriobacteriales bacterium]
MNNQSNIMSDNRGIILSDNVNFDFLKSITPRQMPDFIKFDVNITQNKVAVGMAVHKCCDIVRQGDTVYGGNIFFEDGHIVYESTLNIAKNIELESSGQNIREIVDEDLIEQINLVLFSWIDEDSLHV